MAKPFFIPQHTIPSYNAPKIAARAIETDPILGGLSESQNEERNTFNRTSDQYQLEIEALAHQKNAAAGTKRPENEWPWNVLISAEPLGFRRR